MQRVLIAIIAVAALTGCSHQGKTTVLAYPDFGPQAMAYDLIGMQWHQWDNPPDPKKNYKINVVVYRNMGRKQAMLLHPTDKAKASDYRYVSYDEAVAFLNRHIKDDAVPSITAALVRTRKKIQTLFTAE